MKSFSKSIEKQKERQKEIIYILSELYPDVKIQLNHKNGFELLISTMLSAQCTDDRVNKVTPELFRRLPGPKDFVLVDVSEIEDLIFSTGFYKVKAKNIQQTCSILIEKYNGELPNNIEELTTLPGVGRKTANVVLSHWFGIPAMVVDTHVTRISNLLGFVETTDAVKIEQTLMDLVPKDLWVIFTHIYINFGRQICVARKPKCEICPVSSLCPSSRV